MEFIEHQVVQVPEAEIDAESEKRENRALINDSQNKTDDPPKVKNMYTSFPENNTQVDGSVQYLDSAKIPSSDHNFQNDGKRDQIVPDEETLTDTKVNKSTEMNTISESGYVKMQGIERSEDSVVPYAVYKVTEQDYNPYNEIDDNKVDSKFRPQLPHRPRTVVYKRQNNGNLLDSESRHRQGFTLPANVSPRVRDTASPVRSHLPLFDESARSRFIQNPAQCQGRCILIQGIPDSLSIEEIAINIEAEIIVVENVLEDLTLNRLEKEAVVTLKNTKVTEELLARVESGERFKLAEDEIQVLKYEVPPVDTTKVLVDGLTHGTTSDELSRFFESKYGCAPDTVSFGEATGTAIVCLKSSKDLATLREHNIFPGRVLDTEWTISDVYHTRKVKVKSVTKTTTAAILKAYFENKHLSCGGSTKSVIKMESSNDFIVTFNEIEDAEHVVAKGDHYIEETKLEVTLHYSCIDKSEEFLAQRPPPIQLQNIDPFMCRFLRRSARYKEDLEDMLASHHGKAVWPDGTDVSLQIDCNVDVKRRSAKDKIKHWENNSASVVPDICRFLSVHKLSCALEILKDLMSKMKTMEIDPKNKDLISVFFEDDTVIIAGEIKQVEELEEKVKGIITDLEVVQEGQGQPISKILKLKRHEVVLVKESGCLDRMPKGVQVTEQEGKITFVGQRATVDEAILRVQHLIQSFSKRELEGLSTLTRRLLQLPEARSYAEEIIQQRTRVTGVLELTKDNRILIYCISDDKLKTALSTFNSCFVSTSFTVDNLFRTKDGKQYLTRVESDYKGKVKTQFEEGHLRIDSFVTVHEEIKEKIIKFIDSNSFITELLPVDLCVFRYIFLFKFQEIIDTEQQFQKYNVEIEVIDKKTRKGFMVSGRKDKCKLAFAHLHATIDPVARSDHKFNWTMFEQFLRSKDGEDEIRKIEVAEKSVLSFTIEGHRTADDRSSTELASGRLGHTVIDVTDGDILDIQVDYIVNPTTSTLDNNRGLGRTLVDKGGFGVQKACQQILNLQEGNVFTGSAGDLNFKGIIHVALPHWTGEDSKVKECLRNAVMACLREADKLKTLSIAFPPIGVGQFDFPGEIVAEVLVKSVKEYLLQNGTETFLRQIHICDVEGNVSSQLAQELAKEFANTSIKSGKVQWGSSPSTSLDDTDSGAFRIKKEITVGSLTSEDVDVIVNSTNGRLDLRVGAVSKALANEGGPTIQKECDEKYPDGIIYGQVAETSGGNLKCKAVFHGVLLEWSQDKSHAESVLIWFLKNCLHTAHKRNYASMAFPVLGAGVLKFPVETVADLMFHTISDFEKYFKNSPLKTIRIVIHPSDTTSSKVFEQYFAPEKSTRLSKSSYVKARQSCYLSNVFTGNCTNYSMTIGHVTLRIEHGDLTKSTASVIVNSVGESLDLNSGQISRAIFKAGGNLIQLEAYENIDAFRKNGLVMTNSGKLLCQKVIHVKARNGLNGWKESIRNCLEKVENSGMNSVAFPALGTGGKGFSVEQIARTMAETLQEYVKSDLYKEVLKSFTVCVYNKTMVEKFQQAIKNLFRRSSRKSILHLVWKRSDQKPMGTAPETVVHIYSESTENDKRILKRLQDLQQSIIIPLQKRAFLNDAEVEYLGSEIRKIGQRYDVDASVSNDGVTLTGYRLDKLQAANVEIKRMISGIEL